MSSSAINPYFNLMMIRNAEMFFGRTRLLGDLYKIVVHRQSASLLGPHKIGKSSLLWCATLPEIRAKFPVDFSRYIFVFLDLREYLRKTSEDFFQSVSKAIVAQGAQMNVTLYTIGKGEDAFSNILDQVEEHDFFPVLLMDAFDRVTLNEQFDFEFFEFLRAHASMGRVSYITASISPLYKVCHRGITGSPFFNIFYNYSLEALKPEEASKLISIPGERVGMPFSDSEVTLVLKLAGRHPFFIHRVCHVLFEDKLLHQGSEVNEQLLKLLAYDDLWPHFQDTWKDLSETQQIQLLDEVQMKGNQQPAFPELSESMLFRQFVRSTYRTQFFQMTATDLETALDKIDDLTILGESKLKLMQAVYNRLQHDTIPIITKKGMASRTNVHISISLGFSKSKYYQERKKAIKALLNVLFDIERASIVVDE